MTICLFQNITHKKKPAIKEDKYLYDEFIAFMYEESVYKY